MIEGKLKEILGELGITVLGKSRKGWLSARCPFAPWTHENGTDKNPGFGAKPEANGYSSFSCLTCHKHGNIADLVQKLGDYRQTPYPELATRAILYEVSDTLEPWDASNVEVQEEPQPLSWAVFAGMYPYAHETPAAREYLAGRGISATTSAKLDLRFEPSESRVIIPVYDKAGQLFGFNGRTILPENEWPRSYSYKKSRDYGGLMKSHNILGIHLAQPRKPFFVVEGLFALLRLFELGMDEYVNPVATMGSSLSDRQRDTLVSFGTGVYLCYDNDAAGEDGLFGPLDENGKPEGGGAVDKLRKHVPTYLPLYPYGKNDPDTVTKQEFIDMVSFQFTMA